MYKALLNKGDGQADIPVWISNPLAVLTNTDQDASNGIVIQGNRIIELVPAGQRPVTDSFYTFDASSLVLLPGLINCHHHFYQTLTRALPAALNKELFAWLRALYPVWARMDEASIFNSTQLALSELLLSGCTTTADHHYLFTDDIFNAIDTQVEASQQMGVRVVLTRGSMSLGEKQGGLPPDHVVQTEETILEESERLIKAHHQTEDDAMVQIALAPCSPFSVSPELMKASASLAREYKVLLHTHLAETEDENAFCEKRFGLRPLDYLGSVGWLHNDVWLAHGIHFTEDEISSLGKAGVAISHCPSSNMILASGTAKVLELEAAGVAVGLGVDGSASNDHSNLMQEVRQAFLLQRLKYGSADVSAEDALRWGTQGGARLFNRDSLGTLAAGQLADIALFDLEELRFSGCGDPLTALVSSGAHKARHVMVNGDWKVKDGALVDIDIDELLARHRNSAMRLAGKS